MLSLMATSTLSPVTQSFRSDRRMNALPVETAGATEPDDDSRQMVDTATVHHSSRRVSTDSIHGRTHHRGRHGRSGSQTRKRVKRHDRSPDEAPLEIADVDPQILALMETQMKQASYAVQVSVSEAAALQTRLADSHT